MMTQTAGKIPLLLVDQIGSFKPLMTGINRLFPLSDGTLLSVNTRPSQPSRAFRVLPDIGKVSRMKLPLQNESWVVSAPDDRFILAEPESTNAVVWNPVTSDVSILNTDIPRGETVCADVFEDKLFIIVNWNVSGCGGGFEWSDDDTELAVFDLRKARFSKAFRKVHDHDMRAFVMQSKKRLVGFGYGRASHYCGLFNRKLEFCLKGQKDRNAFSMSHYMSVQFVGTDAERALIMFGSKGNADERAVMRWTLAKRKFEVVGIIADRDLFFRCSVRLCDGSILIFYWERHTENHTIFRYAMGAPLTCLGRILDLPVSAAAQGADGSIYLLGHGTVHRLRQHCSW